MTGERLNAQDYLMILSGSHNVDVSCHEDTASSLRSRGNGRRYLWVYPPNAHDDDDHDHHRLNSSMRSSEEAIQRSILHLQTGGVQPDIVARILSWLSPSERTSSSIVSASDTSG